MLVKESYVTTVIKNKERKEKERIINKMLLLILPTIQKIKVIAEKIRRMKKHLKIPPLIKPPLHQVGKTINQIVLIQMEEKIVIISRILMVMILRKLKN